MSAFIFHFVWQSDVFLSICNQHLVLCQNFVREADAHSKLTATNQRKMAALQEEYACLLMFLKIAFVVTPDDQILNFFLLYACVFLRMRL